MTRITPALCLLALASAMATGAAQAEVTLAPALDSPARSLPRAGSLAAPPALPPDMRDGVEIYQQFRDGLADPDCQPQATDARWQRRFSHAPARLADRRDDILPLFGYVVGAIRDAGLPTEFALIPFVESGYRPAASNRAGPAGLWQFVPLTARNHGVRVRRGYDGRLSPVDSTQAAVRYLKTLHGMFGGDWRLAVMAYNAGENRVLQAVRRAAPARQTRTHRGCLGSRAPPTPMCRSCTPWPAAWSRPASVPTGWPAWTVRYPACSRCNCRPILATSRPGRCAKATTLTSWPA